jgi:hypothetical protein
MTRCWQLLLLSAALVVAGCTGGKPADTKDAQARVDAALQISSPTERDNALAKVCPEAARAGAGEAVVKGVKGIGSPTLQDQVAEDCALKLRDAGQRDAAVEVAKLISSPTKRDEVLKKMAAG